MEQSGRVVLGQVQPGDGVTAVYYSDRHAYTVVRVSPSGKALELRQDIAIRTDGNGMSEDQEYRYEPDSQYEENPQIPPYKAYWQPSKDRFSLGGATLIHGRHAYHDYSF
tara:strand:+ start:1132 stop:1461 length:330 start_codon:yes stop_codon:yes gene_type:complete